MATEFAYLTLKPEVDLDGSTPESQIWVRTSNTDIAIFPTTSLNAQPLCPLVFRGPCLFERHYNPSYFKPNQADTLRSKRLYPQ